jgi:hypothetical protein
MPLPDGKLPPDHQSLAVALDEGADHRIFSRGGFLRVSRGRRWLSSELGHIRSGRSTRPSGEVSGRYSGPLGTAWLAGRFDLPGLESTGRLVWGGGAPRRFEVTARTALNALFDNLATSSCCQIAAQNPAANKTIHQICKSRGRLIPTHSRARAVQTQAVRSL